MRALVIGILLAVFAATTTRAEPVTIFAAASTQQAIDPLLDVCSKAAKSRCRAVYAASSTLARQIANGAPADLFISANTRWMDYLKEEKRVDPTSIRIVATNSLVVIAPKTRGVPTADIHPLVDLLARDRIAMGDPAHVPAGLYAKQALENLQVWERLKPKILAMPNVRAALAVVARDEASSGIVYASDANIVDTVSVIHRFDEKLHDPIVYSLARVTGANRLEVTEAHKMIVSDQGRAVFRAAGFRSGE